MKERLGIALVGLGSYSKEQLAPAFKHTKHCYLAGIVTGNDEKAKEWQKEYNLPGGNIYNYDNFDDIKNNKDIDIVYIVLPNAMHGEFTVRAAQCGKHVICEKPMEVTVEKCQQMITACSEAGVQLSIGYRLHYDPYNMEMMNLQVSDRFGSIKKIIAKNGMDIEPGVWRLNKQLAGGGPLMDVGIYCVQAAIYTSKETPVAVSAIEGIKTDPVKFKEVEEAVSWTMEFPSGLLAECETSYSKPMNLLLAECEKGYMKLEPAFDYSGLKGETSEGKFYFDEISQQAKQMDEFAYCVQQNGISRVPGIMGLRDVKILLAIYESMQTGKRVEIQY